MTKRIFRSIFLVALTVLLASMTFIMGAVHSYFTRVQMQQLGIETALAAHAVANQGLDYFETMDDSLDCRITWIGTDGAVLYDNRSDSGSMSSHLQRQEVVDALESGYGESVRYSDTLLERYIYAARRLPDGTVLRLSTTQSSVLSLVLSMAQYIVVIILAASGLIFFLSRRLSQNVVRPLNSLNLDDPLSNREYEEIQPFFSGWMPSRPSSGARAWN